MKASFDTKFLIFELWELNRKVAKLIDYRHGVFGGTFKRLNAREADSYLRWEDRKSAIRKRLFKRLGFWRYIYFSMFPVSFAKTYF